MTDTDRQNIMIRCMGCMELFDGRYDVCPHCGRVVNTAPSDLPGTASVLAPEWNQEQPSQSVAAREASQRMENIRWPGWNLVGLIGTGSFGSVYEIERDVFGKKERAALKVISIPQSDSDVDELIAEGYDQASIHARYRSFLEEIVREYTIMAEMKGNSNIVDCDDLRYEPRQQGIGWDITIKMELLTPLMKTLGKQISEKDVVHLGRDICQALVLCKQHNIVHRDIKPQNIFVSKYGAYKLGDFGVAKVSDKTASGTKTGTYKYMAPEVYNNLPYGASSDIYSLGMVMYWMLNERRTPFLPLPPDVPTSKMEEKARRRRFSGERLPPPQHGSEELKRIVCKACEFDPKDRYENAAQMLEALDRLMTRLKEPEPDSPAENRENGLYQTAPDREADSHFEKPEESRQKPQKGPPEKTRPKTPVIVASVLAAALLIGGGIYFLTRSSHGETAASDPEMTTAVIQIPSPQSGQCGKDGDNVHWDLSVDGELRVSGTGATLALADEEDPPWVEYKEAIRSIVVEEGITHIGARLFRGCANAASVQLPGSLKSIGSLAFRFCGSLEEITIPAGVSEIKGNAFHGCDALDGDDHILRIHVAPGNQAFVVQDGALLSADGTKLIRVPADASGTYEIPAGVTTIGTDAFCGSKIRKAVLHAAVNDVEWYAFDYCKELEAIEVDADNPDLSSVDGVLMNKTQTTLLICPPGLQQASYTIPSTVQIVRRAAFADVKLTSITFPESVAKIGGNLFSSAQKSMELVFLGDAPEVDLNDFISNNEIKITIVYDSAKNGWDALKSSVDSDRISWRTMN